MPSRISRPSKSAKPRKPSKPTRAAAKPSRPKLSRAKPPREESSPRTDDKRARARAELAAKAGLAKKAEDVLLIDVRGLTSIADYFIVMSGSAGPQLRAIAESVEVEMKKSGAMPLSVEGQAGGNWVLIDFGEVVVHVFEPEVRGFYDLEGLWADAPRERITD